MKVSDLQPPVLHPGDTHYRKQMTIVGEAMPLTISRKHSTYSLKWQGGLRMRIRPFYWFPPMLALWVLNIIFVSHAAAISTDFYVALDNRPSLSFGPYAGLDNPNQGRLTFLLAHPNENLENSHFHSIGAYSYSGPVTAPNVESTNSNNRIPETFSGQPPLSLRPGTGIHAGQLISQHIPGLEYSNQAITSIQALNGFADGSVESFLFNSSEGGYTSTLDQAVIALELVEATPGLSVHDEAGLNIFSNPSQPYIFGDGNTFEFTPTFAVDAASPPAFYSASFRLLDLGNGPGYSPLQTSGTYHIDFRVEPVPEPSTMILLGSGLVGLIGWRRWKNKTV